ncbi:hypothetical protein ACKURH_26685 [Enterobacter soli]|uniref:hypothetical protein n=1 Tax=Enterobacter kobei TaxID=208224 RepID=UPI00330458F8|nr:hypothetical protein [Enterobacter soli]
MKVSAKIIYSPFLILYAMGPFIHDVVPYLRKIDFRAGLHFTLLYLIVLLTLIPLLFLIKKVESKYINLTVSIIVRLLSGTGLFLVPYVVFWSDWPMFYVSLIITLYASFLCMVVNRKEVKHTVLLKDSATGALYKFKGGKAYRLNDFDAARLQSISMSRGLQFAEFSSSDVTGFDVNSSVQSVDHSFSNTDLIVNPSSGMPMIGGISGLDIHGNSWGMNFNEPSNTYDPNRGY